MHWKGITLEQSNLIKGIGIFLIVTHNFMHRFPMPKENEMSFSLENVYNLIFILTNQPSDIPRAIFSYFGHFGVQIFVFISAYGLYKKYKSSNITYHKFLIERLIKIYPIFLISLAFYIIHTLTLNSFIHGDNFSIIEFLSENYLSIILKLSLIFNFFPGEGFSLVGPWWFLSMIFQFYIIFPIILSLYRSYGLVFLWTTTLISLIILIISSGEIYGVNLFFTVIGHLPVLMLGLYLGNSDDLKIPEYFKYIFFLAFLLGNFNEKLFFTSHLFFLIIFIQLSYNYITRSQSLFYKIFNYLGRISTPLFLINGFLRFPLESMAHFYKSSLSTWALYAVFLLLCIVFSELIMRLTNFNKN